MKVVFGDNKATIVQTMIHCVKRSLRISKLVPLLYGIVVFSFSGCAAFIHPINGVSISKLDPSLTTPHRTEQTTIDLTMLRQVPPPEHLADTGDVLGVFIEGILGKLDDVPPIYQSAEKGTKPALGYPVTVSANGTISLPLIQPVFVRGLSISQVQQTIHSAYTQGPTPLLQPNQARVMVSLQQARTYRVLVIRQESDNRQGNLGASEAVNFEADKQGTGRVVELPAYQNDVLHALAETGGLPGLDAQNAIYVIRQGRPAAGPVIRGQSPDRYSSKQQLNPHSLYSRDPRFHQQSQTPVQNPKFSPVSYANHRSVANGVKPRGRVKQLSHNYRTQNYRNASQVSRPPQKMLQTQYSPTRPGQSIPMGTPALPPASIAPPMSAPVQYPQGVMNPLPVVEPHYPVPIRGPVPMQGQQNLPTNLEMSSINMNLINQQMGHGANVLKIPIRTIPGEPLAFSPEDIILYDGDIVFIESREKEFFFTGGLLGAGQYTLPRDYDVNILDAISIAETRSDLPNGNPRSIGGPSVLNQDVSIGASLAIVVRNVPGKGQMRIRVNLYEAMHDPRHQLVIKPGDRIYLRYTYGEATMAYFERHLLQGAILGSTVGAVSN